MVYKYPQYGRNATICNNIVAKMTASLGPGGTLISASLHDDMKLERGQKRKNCQWL